MSKPHKHSPEFKAKVVMEILAGEMATMEASRKYRIKDSLFEVVPFWWTVNLSNG